MFPLVPVAAAILSVYVIAYVVTLAEEKSALRQMYDVVARAGGHAGLLGKLWTNRQHRFDYEYGGRRVVVEATYPAVFRWIKKITRQSPAIEIRVPMVQKLWLRLIRSPASSSGRYGDFAVHTDDMAVANKILNDTVFEREFSRCSQSLSKLEIFRGRIIGAVREDFPVRLLDLAGTVAALTNIASFYEHLAETVLVLVAASAEFCPYCREKFSATGARIVACAECRTLLHSDCWEMNRQCTTWGCKSRLAHETTRR